MGAALVVVENVVSMQQWDSYREWLGRLHRLRRPLFGAGRAQPTIERAERAIQAVGPTKPFLIVYYGSDAAGGWQTVDRPLRTITTLDRFALVAPNGEGHEMRMTQRLKLAA